DQARTAQRLDAGGDADERVSPVAAEALARGEDRGHHHRAGVHGPALEGVVEVLAVRGRAVDHRGVLRAEPGRVAERRARAAFVDARDQGANVIRAAGGDAKSRDVDQQVLTARAYGRGKAACGERGDPIRE